MTNRSSNKAAVPEAKGALDKFKYEVASELGVPLTDGYNGDLTSRQNGSVGATILPISKNFNKTVKTKGEASAGSFMHAGRCFFLTFTALLRIMNRKSFVYITSGE